MAEERVPILEDEYKELLLQTVASSLGRRWYIVDKVASKRAESQTRLGYSEREQVRMSISILYSYCLSMPRVCLEYG